MAQYIDKKAIVAEIEKRKQKLLDHIICERDKEWAIRTAHQLNRIIWFLDTIEVKKIDLEKEFKDFIKCDNGRTMFEVAKYFFELGLKVRKGE